MHSTGARFSYLLGRWYVHVTPHTEKALRRGDSSMTHALTRETEVCDSAIEDDRCSCRRRRRRLRRGAWGHEQSPCAHSPYGPRLVLPRLLSVSKLLIPVLLSGAGNQSQHPLVCSLISGSLERVVEWPARPFLFVQTRSHGRHRCEGRRRNRQHR